MDSSDTSAVFPKNIYGISGYLPQKLVLVIKRIKLVRKVKIMAYAIVLCVYERTSPPMKIQYGLTST
jgi:hypothetical protein